MMGIFVAVDLKNSNNPQVVRQRLLTSMSPQLQSEVCTEMILGWSRIWNRQRPPVTSVEAETPRK